MAVDDRGTAEDSVARMLLMQLEVAGRSAAGEPAQYLS